MHKDKSVPHKLALFPRANMLDVHKHVRTKVWGAVCMVSVTIHWLQCNTLQYGQETPHPITSILDCQTAVWNATSHNQPELRTQMTSLDFSESDRRFWWRQRSWVPGMFAWPGETAWAGLLGYTGSGVMRSRDIEHVVPAPESSGACRMSVISVCLTKTIRSVTLRLSVSPL